MPVEPKPQFAVDHDFMRDFAKASVPKRIAMHSALDTERWATAKAHANTELLYGSVDSLNDADTAYTRTCQAMESADPMVAAHAKISMAEDDAKLAAAHAEQLLPTVQEFYRKALEEKRASGAANDEPLPKHLARVMASLGGLKHDIGDACPPAFERKLLAIHTTGLRELGRVRYREMGQRVRDPRTVLINGKRPILEEAEGAIERDREAVDRLYKQSISSRALRVGSVNFLENHVMYMNKVRQHEIKTWKRVVELDRVFEDYNRSGNSRSVIRPEVKEALSGNRQIKEDLVAHLGYLAETLERLAQALQRHESLLRAKARFTEAPSLALQTELIDAEAASAARKPAEKQAASPAPQAVALDDIAPQAASSSSGLHASVQSLLNSPRWSQHIEGRVASRLLGTDFLRVLGVNRTLRDGTRDITEYDCETERVVFEVTTAKSGKYKQMLRRTLREYNPLMKDQVLVAPPDFDPAERERISALRPKGLDRNAMRTFVTDEEHLGDVEYALFQRHKASLLYC